MRFEELKLTNYRQYIDLDLIFKKTNGRDLQIVIGTNGAGKSNILNAINWCLYGDEPLLHKDSKGLPIVNVESFGKLSAGGQIKVSAEISLILDDGQPLIIERVRSLRKRHSENDADYEKSIEIMSEKLKAITYDEKMNAVIHVEDEAKELVQKTFPIGIREYFFFDGERLHQYFSETQGSKIRGSIYQIAQISLISEGLIPKFKKLNEELSVKVGRLAPNIDKIRVEKEDLSRSIESTKTRIADLDKQITISKQDVSKISAELQGQPDAKRNEKEQILLNQEINQLETIVEDEEKEKYIKLVELGNLAMFSEAIVKSLQVYDEKKAEGRIPPTYSPDLVKEILKGGRCVICGEKVNGDSKKHLEELLNQMLDKAINVEQVAQMGARLADSIRRKAELQEAIVRKNGNLNRLHEQLDEKSLRLQKLKTELAGHQIDEIKDLQGRRDQLEVLLAQNQQNKGKFLAGLEHDEIDLKELEKQFNLEAKKVEGHFETKHQLEVVNESLKVLESAEKDVIEATRMEIQRQTNELFLKLIWKKETYKQVIINEDFTIDVNHVRGWPALGTMSAGEKALLALAFTLSLHEVSGFVPSFIIDTPLARISDENRKNFSKTLNNVSESKQVILLFTPSEYDDEVAKIIDPNISKKYTLNYIDGKNETKVTS
jgi:DNA sulfur modification protein DndD